MSISSTTDLYRTVMIYVESRKRFQWDPHHPNQFYIGRPSVLGNPYWRDPRRAAGSTLPAYRDYLIGQIASGNQLLLQTLLDIEAKHKAGEDVLLLCWCYPAPCHGDVIKECIEEGWIYRCYRPHGIHRMGRCISCDGPSCSHCDDVGSGLLCDVCIPVQERAAHGGS